MASSMKLCLGLREPVSLASQASRHVDLAPIRHVFVRLSLMSWSLRGLCHCMI